MNNDDANDTNLGYALLLVMSIGMFAGFGIGMVMQNPAQVVIGKTALGLVIGFLIMLAICVRNNIKSEK